MNMVKLILKINDFLNSKTMKILDTTGAIAILAYAYYLYHINSENYIIWSIAGVLAIILSIFRPANYFSKIIEKNLRGK